MITQETEGFCIYSLSLVGLILRGASNYTIIAVFKVMVLFDLYLTKTRDRIE